MKQRIAKCLVAVMMLSATSCSNDLGTTVSTPSEETATVRISIGLDGPSGTRADGLLEAGDYATAEDAPEISDGTRATTLIYALYKNNSDGTFSPLSIAGADATSKQVVRTGVKFPVEDISFELVKGFEYTLVFWAQSENGADYYDTSNLEAIEVKYDNIKNNDELRDAFCAKHTMKLTQDVEDVHIILRRPFAQINVGLTRNVWKVLQRMHQEVKRSSIKLSGVCHTYNLLTGNVADEELDFTEIEFGTSDIPQDDETYNTSKYLRVDIDRNGVIDPYEYAGTGTEPGDYSPEEFIWVSMCYVLVADYVSEADAIYSSTLDLSSLTLYYDAYVDDEGVQRFEAGSFEFKNEPNLPALRNHRTNLILDQWPTFTQRIFVELCPDFAGDNPVAESENAD